MDRSESQLSVSLERDPPMNPFAELSEAALLMGPATAPLPDLSALPPSQPPERILTLAREANFDFATDY